ncbi:hypothetical protein C8R44DRAFT_755106 [Mycena epipterygia]|nr:hypothetical protein C8R44DRAFT_755106 [Mycena epipterygia]
MSLDHIPVLGRRIVRQRIENRVEIEGREEAEEDVVYDCEGKRVREEWSRARGMGRSPRLVVLNNKAVRGEAIQLRLGLGSDMENKSRYYSTSPSARVSSTLVASAKRRRSPAARALTMHYFCGVEDYTGRRPSQGCKSADEHVSWTRTDSTATTSDPRRIPSVCPQNESKIATLQTNGTVQAAMLPKGSRLRQHRVAGLELSRYQLRKIQQLDRQHGPPSLRAALLEFSLGKILSEYQTAPAREVPQQVLRMPHIRAVCKGWTSIISDWIVFPTAEFKT